MVRIAQSADGGQPEARAAGASRLRRRCGGPGAATGGQTEAGGTSALPDDLVQQALEAIRPHGPEHVWRPARPYMLPG
jgi:hypothetical protein